MNPVPEEARADDACRCHPLGPSRSGPWSRGSGSRWAGAGPVVLQWVRSPRGTRAAAVPPARWAVSCSPRVPRPMLEEEAACVVDVKAVLLLGF